jgi:hypothetical protein
MLPTTLSLYERLLAPFIYQEKTALSHREKDLVKGKPPQLPEQGLSGRVWDALQTGGVPIPFLMFTKFNKAVNLEQVACTPTAARKYLCYNCSLFHCNLGGLHLVSNCMCDGNKTMWKVTY